LSDITSKFYTVTTFAITALQAAYGIKARAQMLLSVC